MEDIRLEGFAEEKVEELLPDGLIFLGYRGQLLLHRHLDVPDRPILIYDHQTGELAGASS